MRMQPIMLPKFRYDEVNLKYKEAKAETEKLKALIETKDREIEVLRRELAQLREDFDHALMDLQVKGDICGRRYRQRAVRSHHSKDDLQKTKKKLHWQRPSCS